MNDEQEEDSGPTPVMKLEEHGINAGDIKKLQDAGFNTIESICFTPKKTLVLVKGLSEAKVDKIIEAANKMVDLGFQTAGAYFETRKN